MRSIKAGRRRLKTPSPGSGGDSSTGIGIGLRTLGLGALASPAQGGGGLEADVEAALATNVEPMGTMRERRRSSVLDAIHPTVPAEAAVEDIDLHRHLVVARVQELLAVEDRGFGEIELELDDGQHFTLADKTAKHVASDMQELLQVDDDVEVVEPPLESPLPEGAPSEEELLALRLAESFEEFTPSVFARRVPPDVSSLEEDQRVSRLPDLKAALGTPRLGMIRSLQLADVSIPDSLGLGRVLSSLVTLELLSLVRTGLHAIPDCTMPSLLQADLQSNLFRHLSTVVDIVSGSPLLQSLNLLYCPLCKTSSWTSAHPEDGAPDWELVARLPDLLVLNRVPLTFQQYSAAVGQFGTAREVDQLGHRAFDIAFCNTMAPAIAAMEGVWQPLEVETLGLTGQKLTMVQVGVLQHLHTLVLAGNHITSLLHSGLEQCEFLQHLDVSANKIPSHREIPLELLVGLQHILYSRNPMAAEEGVQHHVVFRCRLARGTNMLPGLVTVNERPLTIADRVAAVEFCEPEVDGPRLRWDLGLTAFYGRALLSSAPDVLGNVRVLCLNSLGLTFASVTPLHSLSVLDLRDNQLETVEGVAQLLYLRVLDLSGNPGLRVKQVVAALKHRPVTSLEALALAPSAAKNTAQFRQLLLVSFLSTNPRLRAVEGAPISIDDRVAEARKSKRVAAGKLDAYKFGLAVTASCVPPATRLFGVADVRAGRQYQPEEVEELLMMSHLGFSSQAIDLSSFAMLRMVNLSHNNLTTLRGMGFEHLPALVALDVTHNKIAMPVPELAALLDELEALEALAIAENPCVRRYNVARRQLIGAMRRMRSVDCTLHVIDVEVTIDERVEAWQQMGGADEAEMLRTDAALFQKTPLGVMRADVEGLNLDAMKLAVPRLEEYRGLQVLRLRGNAISTLSGVGLEDMMQLRVLDVRDNQLPLSKDSEVEAVVRYIPTGALEYLGLSGNRGATDGEPRYRQRVIRALPVLAQVGCQLWYLDEQEISAGEIVEGMRESAQREELRFQIARDRAVRGRDPGSVQSLDLSHHGLTQLTVAPFAQLRHLSLAFNQLTLRTLEECGLRSLFFLTHLDISHNLIDKMQGLAELLDGFVRLEVAEVEGNRCFPQNTPPLRRALLKRLSGLQSNEFSIRVLNGSEVSLAERMRALAASKGGGKGTFKAASVHLALVFQERGVVGMETELNLSGLELQRVGVIGRQPRFDNLIRLDLSNNRITTLAQNTLELLPRLHALDLRKNRLPSVRAILRELHNCHALRVLRIQHATQSRSATGNAEAYMGLVFRELPALLTVDEMHTHERLSQDAEAAAQFLYDLAGVSANSLRAIDLTDLQLPSKGFFFILAALCHVPVARLTLRGNFEQGVGPQRSAYRKYVIPALGETLRQLDGRQIGDDERVNLLAWLEKEEERYGRLVKREPWAKTRGQAQLALQRSMAKQAEKAAAKWAIEDDDDDFDAEGGEDFDDDTYEGFEDEDGGESGGEGGEGEDESGAEDDDDHGGLRDAADDVGDALGDGLAGMETLAIQATGTVLAKCEVMINFFQVYGLVLTLEKDIDFPDMWTEITIYYDYLPQLLSLNVEVIFTEFNVPLDEEGRQLVQFSFVMGFVFMLALLYRLATKLDNARWIRDFYTEWELTQRKVRVLYLLMLLGCCSFGVAVDYDRCMESLQDTGFPSPKSYTMAGLLAVFVTIAYNLYFVVANAFRREYIRDDLTDPPRVGGAEFVKWWSLKKRILQKSCLFLLTLFYMPVSRVTFENFAPEKDQDVLQDEGCTHTDSHGDICCLAAYPTLPCVTLENLRPLHITSFVFVGIYVVGMPIFFAHLIRAGVDEIDRQGYKIHHDAVTAQVARMNKEREGLRRSIKNSRKKEADALERYYSLGDAVNEKHEHLANLYASEVQSHPKAQSYLFQAYERKWRFYKILQMMEKLSLVLITLFVSNSDEEVVRLLLGNLTIVGVTAFALVARPFNDISEDLMDCLARSTNSVNVTVTLGLFLDKINHGFANLLLVGFNGVNLAWIFGSIAASPVRAWRARKAFLAEEEKRIAEFRRAAEVAGTELAEAAAELEDELDEASLTMSNSPATPDFRALRGMSPGSVHSGGLPTGSSGGSGSPSPAADAPRSLSSALGRDVTASRSLADIRQAARAAKGGVGDLASVGGDLASVGGDLAGDLADGARSVGGDLARDAKAVGGDLARDAKAMGGDLARDARAMGGDLARDARAMGGDLAADAREGARQLGRDAKELARDAKELADEEGLTSLDGLARRADLRGSVAHLDIAERTGEDIAHEAEEGAEMFSDQFKSFGL